MTLAIAWVRRFKGHEELIVASDSRLSGGGVKWDQCPKIMMLPRSDCVICFAGDTFYAYPLMLQLSLAIDSHLKSRQRAMDLHKMKGHALNVFNELQKSVEYQVRGVEISDNQFIIAGYSWMKKAFSHWLVKYDKRERMFRAHPTSRRYRNIIFAGDWTPIAKRRLKELLITRYGSDNTRLQDGIFDMEPFEVLRDLVVGSGRNDTIGGAPQIVKVYQHMNSRPVAVYWPDRESGNVTVFGRPLLGYENTDYWVLDPYELKTAPVA